MSHNPPNDRQNNSSETFPLGNSSEPVRSNNRRRVTGQEIDLVHNLIERCIQLYMNIDETMRFLSERAGIEPVFTKLIWQKLEEDNPEFFRAYHIRLILIKQINAFNELLEYHYTLINHQATQNIPNAAAILNGTHHKPVDVGATVHDSLAQPQMQSSSSGLRASQRTFQTFPTNLGSNVITDSNQAGEIKPKNATRLTTALCVRQLPLPSTHNSILSSNIWYHQNHFNED